MKLVGLMVTRNSDWIIGFSLRAALLWCDSVVVLMHRCNLDTESVIYAAILDTDEDKGEFPIGSVGRLINRRVFILEDFSEEWEEMRMRQAMLVKARGLGATHIALIDDDEVLTADLLPPIRRMVERTSDGQVLMLPWLQLRQNGLKDDMAETGVMSSGMWAKAWASLAFKDNPVYHWATRGGYDLHHRHPMGATLQWNIPFEGRDSGLMHYQFASRRRLIAKQYLYQLTEMKRWPGRRSAADVREQYSLTVRESDAAQLSPIPASWIAGYEDLLQYLHINAEPWQEAECKRLLSENPRLGDGLNDFGLRREWGL